MAELNMNRGEGATWKVTCLQAPDDAGVRAPLPLGSVTLEFRAVQSYRDTNALFSRTVANGGIEIIDEANGVAKITLVAANTSSLSNRRTKLFWELWATPAAGDPVVLNEGELWVDPAVPVAAS